MQFRFEQLRYRLYELFLKRERASKIKELQENEAKPTYQAFHVQKIKGQLFHFLSFSVNLELFETPWYSLELLYMFHATIILLIRDSLQNI